MTIFTHFHIFPLGTIRPEDSRAVFYRKKTLDVRACMGLNPLDMPRTPYWASEGKHKIESTMPYIIHPINGLHCFYRITMPLK